MKWADLQPQVRRAILMQRRSGRTIPEIAEEIRAGKTTIYRMLANADTTPTKALQENAEQFVETHLERSNGDSDDE